jgi:hypothetical protein
MISLAVVIVMEATILIRFCSTPTGKRASLLGVILTVTGLEATPRMMKET